MESEIVLGSTVGRFTLLRKIGEGGMGVVYQARDPSLDRSVALKFLPAHLVEDRTARERFIREARAASALDHPNICTIHEIGETPDGRLYICMAFCEGESLAALLQRSRISVPQALGIAMQIARGLEGAHRRDIVHRDIKPGNIVISADGSAKIVDFGLARLIHRGGQTSTDSISGTSQYMSPEQIRGEPPDARTDLWSLGVMMYEMLAGKPPFRGEYRETILYEILQASPRPIQESNPDVSKDLAASVDRCLAKDPADRYQTATGLLADLEQIQNGIALPPGHFPASSASRRIRSRGWVPKLLVAAIAAFIAALLFIPSLRSWFGADPPLPERRVLAVLPFLPIGGRAEDQDFCSGMVEVLTAKLTEVRNFQGPLAVIASREVAARRVESPSDAARLLGATLAITGSFQREGAQVRIWANLVDTRTLENVRSSTLDLGSRTGRVLQERVLAEVIGMLGIALNPAASRAIASEQGGNAEAYDLVLQAKGILRRGKNPGAADTAADLCRRALLLDSLSMDAHEGLAGALAARGSIAAAESVLQQGILRKPDSWVAHNNLGVFYFRRGRQQEAEREFRECVRLGPEIVRGFNNLGGVLFMQERWEEARTAFERSLSLAPNASAYSNLGSLLFYHTHDYDRAADLFQKALAINDTDYRLWFNLASAYYWSSGGREKSIAPYRRAAALGEEQRLLAPRNPDLACYLAECYANLGHRDTALSLTRIALSTRPVTPDVYERAAEVFALLHQPEEALRCIDSAMQAGAAPAVIRGNPVFAELEGDERLERILLKKQGR